MKNEYPIYKKNGMKHVVFNANDKAITNKFLYEHHGDCKSSSITRLTDRLRKIRDVIEKDFDKWTLEDVRAFNMILNQSNQTAETKRGIRATFRAFVDWKYNDRDMLKVIKAPKKSSGTFNFKKINDSTILTPEDIKKLIHATPKTWLKAFMLLLYETGARPEEIRLLKWRDVKFYESHGDVSIFAPKTNESRTIPIQDSMQLLHRWKQEYPVIPVSNDYLIFPGRDEKTHAKMPNQIMSEGGLSKEIKKVAKIINLQKPCYPYLFRHSRLTFLYSKLPEHLVKKFAGHAANSDMPGVYSHISNKEVSDAMREKIYDIKDLPPTQREEYNKQIAQQNEKIRLLEEDNEFFKKMFKAFATKYKMKVEGLEDIDKQYKP
jgi:integrase